MDNAGAYVVMIMVNTRGPYVAMVWKMNNCPVADVMDRIVMWNRKSECLKYQSKEHFQILDSTLLHICLTVYSTKENLGGSTKADDTVYRQESPQQSQKHHENISLFAETKNHILVFNCTLVKSRALLVRMFTAE